MPKPRRKSEIRVAALRQSATLREAAHLRAAFLKPQPRSWHDLFLAALHEGQPVSAAARAAGVARSTAHKARTSLPGFDIAWRAAYLHGLAIRNARRFNANSRRFNAGATRNEWCELGPPEVDSFARRERLLSAA